MVEEQPRFLGGAHRLRSDGVQAERIDWDEQGGLKSVARASDSKRSCRQGKIHFQKRFLVSRKCS